jgi:hypothetical protein
MSSEFARYGSDIEALDPQLDEPLEQIIAFWEKKGRESPKTERTGRAVRGAHAKAIGVVRAEVEFLHDVPASAKVRRELNHEPQTEPTSPDEVLPPLVGPDAGRAH